MHGEESTSRKKKPRPRKSTPGRATTDSPAVHAMDLRVVQALADLGQEDQRLFARPLEIARVERETHGLETLLHLDVVEGADVFLQEG